MKHVTSPRAGNILFILLIAIALFTGLSVVISQSGKNVGNGKREKAALAAAEIIDYTNTLKIAVQKLRYNGCADTDFSFENNVVAGYEHGGAGAKDACKVFKPTGGKLKWKTPDPKWMETAYISKTFLFSNDLCIKNLGITGPDLSGPLTFCDNSKEGIDLVVSLVGIKKEICEEINHQLGGSRLIPLDLNVGIREDKLFIGNYNSEITLPEIGDTNEALTSKEAYCFQHSSVTSHSPNAYVFYNVLLVR